MSSEGRRSILRWGFLTGVGVAASLGKATETVGQFVSGPKSDSDFMCAIGMREILVDAVDKLIERQERETDQIIRGAANYPAVKEHLIEIYLARTLEMIGQAVPSEHQAAIVAFYHSPAGRSLHNLDQMFQNNLGKVQFEMRQALAKLQKNGEQS